jgi:hypothetical protein
MFVEVTLPSFSVPMLVNCDCKCSCTSVNLQKNDRPLLQLNILFLRWSKSSVTVFNTKMNFHCWFFYWLCVLLLRDTLCTNGKVTFHLRHLIPENFQFPFESFHCCKYVKYKMNFSLKFIIEINRVCCNLFISHSVVLRQVCSLFQSEFSAEYDQVLPLSVSSILVLLRSSGSCLHFLHCLAVPSIPSPIFPLIMCFRRQLLCKMWPIQLVFLLCILCRLFLSSLSLCNTSTFLTLSVQLIFTILPQHHILCKMSHFICIWIYAYYFLSVIVELDLFTIFSMISLLLFSLNLKMLLFQNVLEDFDNVCTSSSSKF